jgi:hypothetical protein
LDVHATLDWVLFARRRESSCDQEVVTPPVKTTCHEVWRLVATPDVLGNLANDNLSALETLGKPLGTVEFAVGTFSIASGGEAVLQKWKEAGDGVLDKVYVFAKQSDPTAESSLLVPRGQSIGRLVSPTGMLVTNPREIALLNVPTTCPAITFLVAQQPVVDRVVAFRNSDAQTPNDFTRQVTNNNNLRFAMSRFDATTKVSFTDNVGNPADATDLVTELKTHASELGPIALVALVTRRTEDSGRGARVKWILDKLVDAGLTTTDPPVQSVTVPDKDFQDKALPLTDATNDLIVLIFK